MQNESIKRAQALLKELNALMLQKLPHFRLVSDGVATQLVPLAGFEADPGLRAVREFHRVFEVALPKLPSIPRDPQVCLTRLQLITEETSELAWAMAARDLTKCLDALVDLSYVVDGTYLSLGLGNFKLGGLKEVHASNMTKLGKDGRPIKNEAGRVVKGPNYRPPDFARLLSGLPRRRAA